MHLHCSWLTPFCHPLQVGEQRAIVSAVAGTTRDAIDTDFTTADGKKFRLIDTAGIRRKGAVAASADGAESLSVQRAMRAVRRCEVRGI